jgi:hypothetical protein
MARKWFGTVCPAFQLQMRARGLFYVWWPRGAAPTLSIGEAIDVAFARVVTLNVQRYMTRLQTPAAVNGVR